MDLPPAADRVSLLGLTAHGRHGVLDEERRTGQTFLADVVLQLSVQRAAARDDLRETVDYASLAARVHDVLAGQPCALIETVASRVAAVALGHDERVAAVEVTIHKPEAPVGVPFRDVAVTVHRTRDDALLDEAPATPVPAVLGLGANLADPAQVLAGAVAALAAAAGITPRALSPVIETAPVGGPAQPRFLNAVALVSTTLSARALLHLCQDVERAHGRERAVRWGPRTLDVDLVSYGTVVARTPDLELPHPRAAERAFVLQPWLAVDPAATLRTAAGPVAVAGLLADLVLPADALVPRPDVTLARGDGPWVSSE